MLSQQLASASKHLGLESLHIHLQGLHVTLQTPAAQGIVMCFCSQVFLVGSGAGSSADRIGPDQISWAGMLECRHAVQNAAA
jgi:hypothetical protein